MTCQQLTELITEYLEGRMSFWRRLQFQVHLGLCKACRVYLRQMKATIQTLGRLPEEVVPPEMREVLLKHLAGMKPKSD